jgi:hypothetical protein
VFDRSDKKRTRMKEREKKRVSSICHRKYTCSTRAKKNEIGNYNFTVLSYCYQRYMGGIYNQLKIA